MFHVFIDGQNGTTGLQIRDRLKSIPTLLSSVSTKSGARIKAKQSIIGGRCSDSLLADEAAIQTAALISMSILIDATPPMNPSVGLTVFQN